MSRRHDPGVLSIDEARAAILAAVVGLPAEEVDLAAAHGRVLAEDVAAAHAVPPFDNSAMDGYAVGSAGSEWGVVGESRAGRPYPNGIGEGEAVVISTGAAVPEGTFAVIPIERAEKAATEAAFTAQTPEAGANVRRAGEDLAAGAVVLARGTRMGPAELGVAAGAGRARLSVAKRPRVAIVATGDELVPPGAPLQPGQIHDSNALSLAALSTEAGAQVVGVEHSRDAREATTQALSSALDTADLLLVSGGVSVGPHDHVKPALESLGVEEVFWRVSLRPGKPTWVGTRGDRLVIGLPGNPVSALVTFVLFARPALAALQGASPAPRRRVVLAEPLPRNPERDEAVRVRLDADGRAHDTGPQGSHVLSSMLGADGLAIVPAGEGVVRETELELL